MSYVHDIKVLDHGYVRSVETWGSDEGIIEAARMSTQKGFEGWGPHDAGPCVTCDATGKCHACGPEQCHDCKGTGRRQKLGDEKLLAYLWKNKHATPFEMAGLVIEVQAPIFVFREWHRHRTQSYNEMSARYAPLPDLNYIPSVERLLMGGGHLTKQAGTVAGAEALTEAGARVFQEDLGTHYRMAETLYQEALAGGVPKELARLILPVGRYSRMRASANLRNWLGFLTLRMEKAAQWEIRQYANAVHDILRDHFPRTLALFDEGRK
jgi:thymidylate synthase (FAD)